MWPASRSSGARDRCRGCDHPRPAYNGGYASVRSSLAAMQSYAKSAGCPTCAILSDGILQFLSSDCCELSRDDVDDVQIDFNLAGGRRSLEVALIGSPVKLWFFCSERTPWIAANLPDLPVGREIPPVTSSDESLAWAKAQIEHCRRAHEACNAAPDSSPLPARVLDVAAGGGSGVRLYESRGEAAAYVSLSHCWGRRPFLRTLSGNLSAHRDGIAWERLPPTFRDAVQFTRRLGIRYLWIDSLCIVQDDRDDWRREAARMGSIYQHAALVISAAKAGCAYDGLYADVPAKHRVFTVVYSPPGQPQQPHHTETIHVRQSLTHTHRLLSPYHAPPTVLPILTRGWIFQERLLSRRVLYFGPEELTFECLESTTCQCSALPGPQGPDSSPSPYAGQDLAAAPAWYRHVVARSSRPKTYFSAATWAARMTPAQRRTCWRRLVEDYTRLRLTLDRDVFPALSGMARLMRPFRDLPGPAGPASVGYHAGLWADSLLADLLWHVQLPPLGYAGRQREEGQEEEEEEDGGGWAWMRRPARWRAPSWSWAAVRAPVEFIDTERGLDGSVAGCEVVEVASEAAGPDAFGELREGGSYLVLRGRLVPATLRFRERQQAPRPWNLIDLDMLDGYMTNIWADDDCRSSGPSVYCLMLGQKLPTREPLWLLLARLPPDDPRSEAAAAWERRPGEDPHLYRRIGLLEIMGAPPRPQPSRLWGWLHDLLERGEDKTVRIV